MYIMDLTGSASVRGGAGAGARPDSQSRKRAVNNKPTFYLSTHIISVYILIHSYNVTHVIFSATLCLIIHAHHPSPKYCFTVGGLTLHPPLFQQAYNFMRTVCSLRKHQTKVDRAVRPIAIIGLLFLNTLIGIIISALRLMSER